jgi:hypothetical protein
VQLEAHRSERCAEESLHLGKEIVHDGCPISVSESLSNGSAFLLPELAGSLTVRLGNSAKWRTSTSRRKPECTDLK